MLLGLNSAKELPGDSEPLALSDRSIAVLGLYHQEDANLRAKRLPIKASMDSPALKPSPFTIATEDYRFSYRIVAWTNRNPDQTFLSFDQIPDLR